MRITRRRLAFAVLLALIFASASWALAPLFLTTHADVAPPETFTSVVKQGTWAGVDGFHFGTGDAKILTDGEGGYLLRLEDFGVRNGPDIHFLLSADGTVGPGDADLGPVPATTGSYHVAIPAGTDVSSVGFALVHCIPANFLFARAPLA